MGRGMRRKRIQVRPPRRAHIDFDALVSLRESSRFILLSLSITNTCLHIESVYTLPLLYSHCTEET